MVTMREKLDELARLQEAAMAEKTTIAICAYRRALLRDGDALLEYVRELQRERDEASQLLRAVAAILNPHDPYDPSKLLGWARDTVERAREADEALAHAADLRGELEAALEQLDGPVQRFAGDRPHCALCHGGQRETGEMVHQNDCLIASLKASLARTPEKSIGRLKAGVLRRLDPLVEKCGEAFDEVVYWSEIQAEADSIEKEATDA